MSKTKQGWKPADHGGIVVCPVCAGRGSGVSIEGGPVRVVVCGYCRGLGLLEPAFMCAYCGSPTIEFDGFESVTEWHISELCQDCQDEIFL